MMEKGATGSGRKTEMQTDSDEELFECHTNNMNSYFVPSVIYFTFPLAKS